MSLSKDTTFPELTHDDNDSSCSCGGETRETSVFPKAFDHEILTPIESDSSPPPPGDNRQGITNALPSTTSSTTGASQLQQKITNNTSFTMVPNSASSGTVLPQSGHPVSSQPPLISDLTPIIESSKLEESSPTSTDSQLAQTQCDNAKAHNIAQNDQTTMKDGPIPSDKKRATSVTFDVGNEPELSTSTSSTGPVTEGTQETRKQKVRL